jgi:hypothetical protein
MEGFDENTGHERISQQIKREANINELHQEINGIAMHGCLMVWVFFVSDSLENGERLLH